MSNFLQMLPRRLPVALAGYVAVTEEDEFRRRAVAKRIYAALPTEQQLETGRICEALSANAQRIGCLAADDRTTAVSEDSSKPKQAW